MLHKYITLFFFIIMISYSSNSFSQYSPGKIPVIPIPKNVQAGAGNYVIKAGQTIYYNDSHISSDIELFNRYLEKMYGFRLNTKQASLLKEDQFNIFLTPEIDTDCYKLEINSHGIIINGGNGAGVFYALQTLTQLLPAGNIKELPVASVSIEDSPRFKYRGMHLDVARHFFSVDDVKKYIDYLALYKMNTFHWHLTDDQGWRVEIKRYPLLQTIGAWRNSTLIGHISEEPERYDTIRYSGYYTQEEIKDIVNYASERHIEIIPEIEMPGHALAALAAYPQYSCTGGPFETGRKWGIFNDVFCPKEETFSFLENILDEICPLFPGKYIHIGGDECPKDRWKECAHCQKLIKEENLVDENGLQNYFTNRIATYLKKKNKTAIGWDEILNNNLDSNAVIMSWRGYNGGAESAVRGHDVIMAPYTNCYFDAYQTRFTQGKLAIGGYLPLDQVFRFEPVPGVLNVDQSKHILGAQGNLWTEYITNLSELQEMAFPRICALAEVLWSPTDSRDYNSFTARLISHFKFLNFNKIKYSTALYDINSKVTPGVKGGIDIELFTRYPRGQVHYSLNGTEPTLGSPVFGDKINVDQSVSIRAALFEGVQQLGGVFSQVFSVNQATAKDVILANAPHPEYSTGGAFTLVDGVVSLLPWLPGEWLGFLGTDLDATIDLGSEKAISRISVDVLKDVAGKIFLPSEVSAFTSSNGKDFIKVATIDRGEIIKMKRNIKMRFPVVHTRWIKVVAKNSNGKDWLFVDEISAE